MAPRRVSAISETLLTEARISSMAADEVSMAENWCSACVAS